MNKFEILSKEITIKKNLFKKRLQSFSLNYVI